MWILFLILLFMASYFAVGAAYVLFFYMWQEDCEWDNIAWLIWPAIAWRKWRLHRYIKHQNDKWRNF